MPSTDRDYFFVGRTYDLPTAVADHLEPAMAGLCALVDEGLFRNVRVLESVGAVEMSVTGGVVRPCNIFVLSELAEDAPVERALRSEEAAFSAVGEPPLSRQLLRRPADAGFALPRRSPHHEAMPPGFSYAIEYLWVPPESQPAYEDAMRRIFGPLGVALVAQGDAYRVVIMEVVENFRFDPSLPRFNQIHVLSGNFDDTENGFLARADAVVRAIAGEDATTMSELEAIAHLREKPRMSKSREVPAFSIGPD